MTRAVKTRLIAFLVLSAVGIVYVAGSYLGIVDRILGRGLTVHAILPASGGLFVGSEVTYRGVKVGKVSGMEVIPSGARVDLALHEGTRIPKSSKLFVHNLSAVGEQYLDFEPASEAGPYAADGLLAPQIDDGRLTIDRIKDRPHSLALPEILQRRLVLDGKRHRHGAHAEVVDGAMLERDLAGVGVDLADFC